MYLILRNGEHEYSALNMRNGENTFIISILIRELNTLKKYMKMEKSGTMSQKLVKIAIPTELDIYFSFPF